MRAAVLRRGALVVDTLPDPEPGPGEVLVRTLACGICGSDLHALRHLDALVEAAHESGVPFVLDPARDVVMGHEFCAEIVGFGPETQRSLRRGTRVVSLPLAVGPSGEQGVGYSNDYPGGYGELMRLSELFLLPVPNGLGAEHAALTEPMAVGVHAVAKAGLAPGDAPLVVGCGPVGLAVIAALALRGAEPIVAADFSPARDALRGARIVVVGVCMEDDRIRPMRGINKELAIQFVLGYTPDEFAGTLRDIAEGRIPVAPLVTGRVGVDGVAGAFEALARPDAHAKILVDPGRA